MDLYREKDVMTEIRIDAMIRTSGKNARRKNCEETA
jgi:hypothetical protein